MLRAVEAPLSGHPDKVCDLLVESVVDEYLRRDMLSKMDIQALGSNGMVMLGGVVDSRADFDVAEIAKQAYTSVGYVDPIELFVNLERPGNEHLRAPRVAGASGTAIVYGYATRETRELMPRSVVYANSLARRVDDLRKTDTRFAWLRPDGKIQLVMQGEQVISVTVVAAHAEDMDITQVQTLLLEHAVVPVLGNVDNVKVFINPVGPFTTGGFTLNAGVSGRKILSDTYGGLLPHGGVAMVGKDPLKPSRAGAYMSRFVAREIVKEGLAASVLITAVYSVGLEEPVSLFARAGDGTDLSPLIAKRFDFRSEAIVERFNLRRPIYATCANYGMFGREGVPWEE
ncbi:MAG: methionine adenosyltransferase domain-containing protein [Patescibacteria group bacterium]